MADALQTVRESYGRCTLQKAFFEDFYDIFMSSSPEIKPFFSRTDMTKQRQLLREGISFMLLYAQKNEGGKLAINNIGQLHDQNHVNVRPNLYRLWIDSLLKCIEKHDNRFTEDVRRAWEEILKPGIDRFVDVYEVAPE